MNVYKVVSRYLSFMVIHVSHCVMNWHMHSQAIHHFTISLPGIVALPLFFICVVRFNLWSSFILPLPVYFCSFTTTGSRENWGGWYKYQWSKGSQEEWCEQPWGTGSCSLLLFIFINLSSFFLISMLKYYILRPYASPFVCRVLVHMNSY